MIAKSRQELRGTHDQKQALGREIAGARVRLGMEQAGLGEKIGRSQEWVSRVEQGLVTLSAFEYARVAHVLDIPAKVLAELAWQAVPGKQPRRTGPERT